MNIVSIILSSLALLAVLAVLALLIHDRKRNQKRNTALMQYADAAAEDKTKSLLERVIALENGTVPDYEKAKAAVDAVNDFNEGLSNILGYDPMDVMRRQRSDNGGGELA